MNLPDRLKGNLLESLVFDNFGEAGNFIKARRCAMCFGHLVRKFAHDRKYTVECPECGPIYSHNHVHYAEVEKLKDQQLSSAIELRD